MSVTTRQPSDAAKIKTFSEELKSFFLGDDVFISYARRDTTGYALALANRLGEKDFICYLDQYGTDPNDQLDERVKRKLRRSRVLVLIGSQSAVMSSAIRQEVELFKKTERAIIPIDIDGAFRDTELYRVVRGLPLADDSQSIELLNESAINLRNDDPSTSVVRDIVSTIDDLRRGPSRRVIDRVASTISYTKRTQLQRRMLFGGSLFLLISFGFGLVSLFSASKAMTARDAANKQAQEAQLRSDQAREARELAEKKANDAELKRADEEKKAVEADTKRQEAEAKEKSANLREAQATANAQLQEKVSSSLEQVEQAARLIEDRPADALAISATAFKATPNVNSTRRALLNNLQYYPYLKSLLVFHDSFPVTSLSSALNGRVIASLGRGMNEGTLNFYDTETKRQIDSAKLSEFDMGEVRCIPTGNLCAGLGFRDGSVNIAVWRFIIDKGQLVVQPLEPVHFSTSYGSYAPLSHDRLVAYNSREEQLLIWDLTKPQEPPKNLEWSGELPAGVAVSPDNKTLVLGRTTLIKSPQRDLDTAVIGVSLWQFENPEASPITVEFPGRVHPPESLENFVFSPDGKFLAVSTSNGTVWLIDALKKEIIGGPLKGAGSELAFAPLKRPGVEWISDSSRSFLVLVSCNVKSSRVTSWEITKEPRGGERLFQIDQQYYGPQAMKITTLSDQSNTLVIAGDDGSLALWDTNAKLFLDSVSPFGLFAGSARPRSSGQGAHLAFDDSGTILLWDNQIGDRDILRFSGEHLTPMTTAMDREHLKPRRFSPWAYADKGVFLIDPMKSNVKPQKLRINAELVQSAASSPDGKLLALLTPDKVNVNTAFDERVHISVVVWELKDVNNPQKLRAIDYAEDATNAAFSRDGKLAVGYRSGRIVVWDVATGAKLSELTSSFTMTTRAFNRYPHVGSLAFSRDGKTIASSSYYAPLALWDVRSGMLIGTLEKRTQALFSDYEHALIFSSDGKKLISSSRSGIRVWDTDPASWAQRARQIANRN